MCVAWFTLLTASPYDYIMVRFRILDYIIIKIMNWDFQLY